MTNEPWPGFASVYTRLQRHAEHLACNGHAFPAMKGRRGRILQPGSVTAELAELVDILGSGDEDRMKAAIHHYELYTN